MKTTARLTLAVLVAGFCFSEALAREADRNAGAGILEAAGTAGGLVVHLGCGDGGLTAALCRSDALLVCGLDTDANRVAAAQKHIDSLGLYGKVSAEQYDGENLPYGDNMVNLVVVDSETAPGAAEIRRILVPGGKVFVRSGKVLEPKVLEKSGEHGPWIEYTKPWPDEIDEWTHYLYDASGNAVCKDKRIRYPRHTQWYAGPRFARHHDALASLSAMTSSGGRVFYIYDEGTISVVHRPAHWKLIARDAFNGKLLWKREISDWMTHLYNFRAGPTQLTRRLVSSGDEVYTTLGFSAPAIKLDAATGETLLTYEGSEGTEEIVLHDGILLVATGNTERHIEASDEAIGYWDQVETDMPVPEIAVMAYDAATGRRLWRVEDDNLGHLMPLSLCALGSRVFYLDDKQLHCLDARSGRQRWAAPFEPPAEGIYMRNYAPTVVAYQDVVLCLTWNSLVAWSIDDGQILWKQKGAIGFGSPGDLFVIDGKAWTFPMLKGIARDLKAGFINGGETGVAVDIHTGEIAEILPFQRTQHHHRCYRNKATDDFFLLGHSGIQVVDRKTKESTTHRWVRGECSYGIMPANGYVYVPPDPCQCYFDGKINGLFALADRNSWADVDVVSALEKGPAYGAIREATAGTRATAEQQLRLPRAEAQRRRAAPLRGMPKQILSRRQEPSDWPTYRGDPARSGAVVTRLPDEPQIAWDVAVGQSLTAPVVAAGRVYLADKDAYTVHCLDAKSGKPLWKFFARGAVDSPPTVVAACCVFGCLDGSVYCLDAETGRLAWRFKTSKTERRIGWENRLASPLLVHGSVLVVDGTVYFAAGHSSNLDGGIRLYGLDLQTGKQLYSNRLASGHWGNDGKWGYLSDILTYDGNGTIGMRGLGFNEELQQGGRPGLRRGTALLDDTWFHRKVWQYGGNAGKLIVFGENQTVTAGNIYTGLKQRRKVSNTDQTGSKWNQVGHFHQKFTRYLKEDWFPVGTDLIASGRRGWSVYEDLQPRAMAMAADKLCVAGWIDRVAIELKTGCPKNPLEPDPHAAVLRIFSMDDGKRLCERVLPSDPVFDGLAVADGGIFVACKDGRVLYLK